jgi:hypothetical protein
LFTFGCFIPKYSIVIEIVWTHYLLGQGCGGALIVSSQNFEYNRKPAITHQFDAGAAWETLPERQHQKGLLLMGYRDWIMSEQKGN